jgi:hypothetical protein
MPIPSNITYKFFVDKMGGTNVNSYIGNLGEMFYDPYEGIIRLSNGIVPGGVGVTGANVSFTVIDGGVF